MILAVVADPLVHVNAALNAAAAVLLLVGWALVKGGRVTAHKRVMLSALGVSVAFLVCYLWYHYHAGHVRFTHPGAVRYVYLAILASHTVLAAAVPFLAVWTVYLGLRATGGSGDGPLFLSQGAAPQHNGEQEKGTVPLGNASSEGDGPLFANSDQRHHGATTRKKGTVPDRVAYRQRHRRWARWTFPIWLYVSITGVVVYAMLYHLWPPA